MTIDIISYTDEQFAKLTQEQILEVRSAQLKKNTLTKQLQDKLNAERHRFAKNGMLLSSAWESFSENLTAEYEGKITQIRDALLFYLQFTMRPEEESSPYPLDYSLSMEDRYYAVRDYYLATYSSAKERFNKFEEDDNAQSYLGEYYGVLHNYFKNIAEAG